MDKLGLFYVDKTYVLIHIRIMGEVGTVKLVLALQ